MNSGFQADAAAHQQIVSTTTIHAPVYSLKSPQTQSLTYKSEQPMLKYESYATQKIEQHSGAHQLQHEEHRDQTEMEESFTLVPVSVRRADYESKSAQSYKVTRSSKMKPMIDVFSV
ncbi:hypothetical protein Aduo_017641 [Ancylostoma duodenale]